MQTQEQAQYEPISRIAMATKQVEEGLEHYKGENTEKLQKAVDARRELIADFSANGLLVTHNPTLTSLDEISEKDDGGKIIETNFKVTAKNSTDVRKIVKLCKKHKALAMPIGSKSSALGVFAAMSVAKQKGLKWVIGIQSPTLNLDTDYTEKEAGTQEVKRTASEVFGLTIPEFDENEYELVEHPKFPIALLKAKNFPPNAHRVIVHAGATIDDVNKYVDQMLGGKDSKFKYRVMADPTSKKEAQVGGVIATGAEGGNRTKASDDLQSVMLVDGNGKIRPVSGEALVTIVGLNGNAGHITQAEFKVSAFPKNEHAVFLPIKGEGKTAWKNLLKLQKKLKPHCKRDENNGHDRLQVGNPQYDGLIITGLEPLSKTALEFATEEQRTNATNKKLNGMLENSEFGVYMTFSSFSKDFSSDKLNAFLKDVLQGEYDAEDDICYNNDETIKAEKAEEYDRIYWIDDKREREHVDKVRHSAPEKSRSKAKSLGGATISSDLNIRIETENEEEHEAAMEQLSEIFDKYAAQFSRELGFQVAIYGHLHPGAGLGGGLDPHIRILYELSNPTTRYVAPEQVAGMKKLEDKLYAELFKLNGKNGVQINCPEKSRFTNASYWKWMCLYQPEEAEKYLKTIVEYGYARDKEGNPTIPTMGARVPHKLPGSLPRVPGEMRSVLNNKLVLSDDEVIEGIQGFPAVLQKHWLAILELSQMSHRGSEVKRMLTAVCDTVQEKFKLNNRQYPFFIEDQSEAKDILVRNLGDNYEAQGFSLQEVSIDSLEQLDTAQFSGDDKTFYSVNIAGIGVPKGLSLLISPHEGIKTAHQNPNNKAGYRNLHSMWSQWPAETFETPNLPAIAALGVLLQQDELSQAEPMESDNETITVNPGPAQLHPVLLDKEKYIQWLNDLKEGKTCVGNSDVQKNTINAFREFIGLRRHDRVAFTGSATQSMQMLADAIKQHETEIAVIQVSNDAFSDRFSDIFKKTGIKATTIRTPYTTSEASELERVVAEIATGIDAAKSGNKRPLVFITPHKTSTTATFSPDILLDALSQVGITPGKDFDMVCDLTSGVGAVDYATEHHQTSGNKYMPFAGSIGAFQKGMGLPAGLGYVSLTPELAELLGYKNTNGNSNGNGHEKPRLNRALDEVKNGTVLNEVGLDMLRQKLAAEKDKKHSISDIQGETQNKIDILMGWMRRHKDMMPLVQNSADRQQTAIVGMFTQARNLVVAKRILGEMGMYLGSGYGAFEGEAIRFYLSNIGSEELLKMLSALELSFSLEDVTTTRGESVPNIALREPHNPLSVIDRLSKGITVDDVFNEEEGLMWLGRIVRTFNANNTNGDRVKIYGEVPPTTTQFDAKAVKYGHEINLESMQSILNLKDGLGFGIMEHYDLVQLYSNHIKGLMAKYPEATNDPTITYDGINVAESVEFCLNQIQDKLKAIAALLHSYVKDAPKDAEGRVLWPIAA